jgi:hypothetical protein
MSIEPLLAHLHELEAGLGAELRAAAERQRGESDVYHQCQNFALAADKRAQKLQPLADGHPEWTTSLREGGGDPLEELRTLYLRTQEVAITWTMAAQGAKALRDSDLLELATECQSESETQAKWFTTRIKTAAPQSLTVR